MTAPIPIPDSQTGLHALKAMLKERTPLAALQVFHDELGDIFRINLPGFTPIVMVGPDAAHFVLVDSREDLRWRNESDPVTDLLRHGVLVEDGESHDQLRSLMNPSLHRKLLKYYLKGMWDCTNQVLDSWSNGEIRDMLVEMRKIALLILTRSLFQVDLTPDLDRLWRSVLGVIRYISPGIWMIWRNAPRRQYNHAIQQLDTYLYQIIEIRRNQIALNPEIAPDLLTTLITSGMQDPLIRDQLLTMLIAGHDTSTALLAWALYLLGRHPDVSAQVKREIATLPTTTPPTEEQLAELSLLEQVIRETLRLYPPIHLGSRLAAKDLQFSDYLIPAGERVIYSIYLTQRHKMYWENPHRFYPERHMVGKKKTPYTWLAFGGGPRNCIGAAFGQIEAKVVLTSLLQRYNFTLQDTHVRPYMGATLEPHPGVFMRVYQKKN